MGIVLVTLALAGPGPCGTPTFLALRDGPTGAAALAPPGAEKTERDAWGSYPNSLASPNFVVKWGDVGRVSTSEVEALLVSFEAAWAAEIEDWGHPAPLGTDRYLFNVYIGDTGDGTAASNGAGGYYWRDEDDQPYILIARDSLYYAEYVEGTAAHEFYHALQDVVAVYGYGDGDPAAWYWEATADWAQGEVFPENGTYAQFLMGYAWLPELSVTFFDYPDRGTLQEYHQYGAFIFPRYLTEFVADRQLVVDSWVDPGGSDDPLEVLGTDLAAQGVDLADAFGDFAAHDAVWDYADGATYSDALQDWVGWFDDSSAVGAVVEEGGTGGWIAVDDALRPERYAYVLIELPTRGEAVTVSVEGDVEGTRGSPADWRAQVVVNDGRPSYLALEDGAVDVPRGDPAYLVVAAVPAAAASGEVFGFRYSVAPAADAEDTGTARPGWRDDEDGKVEEGCGCGMPATGGGMGALAAALACVRWRRRRSG